MTVSSKSENYASIQLGGVGRNVEYLGALVAWLVSNSLLEPAVERDAGAAAARVRMQDLDGPAFLTTVLHGELKPGHLTEAGQKFLDGYFVSGQYEADYNDCRYSGEDEWLRFDEVSPRISKAYREFSQPEPEVRASVLRSVGAKVLQFPGLKKSDSGKPRTG